MATDYALLAEPLVRAGAHSVIIDFINVDQAKGRFVSDVRAGASRTRLGPPATQRASAAIQTGFTISAHSLGAHIFIWVWC